MKRKEYKQPAIKILSARLDEMMFTPGGGVSESSPGTPIVSPPPALEDNAAAFEIRNRSVWDTEEEESF